MEDTLGLRSSMTIVGLLFDMVGFALLILEYRLALARGLNRSAMAKAAAGRIEGSVGIRAFTGSYLEVDHVLEDLQYQNYRNERRREAAKAAALSEATDVIQELSDRSKFFWAASALIGLGFALQLGGSLPDSAVDWLLNWAIGTLPTGTMHLAILSGMDWFGLAITALGMWRWLRERPRRLLLPQARRNLHALRSWSRSGHDRTQLERFEIEITEIETDARATNSLIVAGMLAILCGALPWHLFPWQFTLTAIDW